MDDHVRIIVAVLFGVTDLQCLENLIRIQLPLNVASAVPGKTQMWT